MFEWVIDRSIRHPYVVCLLTIAMALLGIRAFQKLPIDAIPDLTNVQVQILTSAPALAPLDVERLVSVPVEMTMTGLPRTTEIRSASRYGVSAVTVVFEDGVDPFLARQLVGERLIRARDAVPSEYGVPELGPMSTGLGEIYQFEVAGTDRSPMELRSILDWDIAPKLRMVPGIVEVNTFGGELKTYEVAIDVHRLAALSVTLDQVFTALERNNRSSGGGAINRGPEGLLIRGDALITSLDDIGRIIVTSRDGVPIFINQLGTVRFGPMLRQGAASRDGRGEIVAGMTMMIQGENSRTVATAVQAAVDKIQPTLPPGVAIKPFYDRTGLVTHTIQTVTKNLIEGGVLVIVVLVLMLRNLRAGAIAASMIPLAMLVAFIGMRAAGVSGNLMSLGALDFGLVVDGAIILLENAVFHMGEAQQRLGRLPTREERNGIVLQSALEVRTATAFGELIIALVYLPILTLQGVEGKMFEPMALTVLFALLGAFVLSLTFVPAVAAIALPLTSVDKHSPLVEWVRRPYAPVLRATLHHPLKTMAAAVVVLAVTLALGSTLGSEFVPRLDEGAIIIETNRPPSTSLEESVRQSAIIENTLKVYPEVVTVVVKTGRPEIANDPMGVEQSDVYVILKPRDEWPGSKDHEELVARMEESLRSAVPGAAFGFSQPIEMRMNELVSGVRSDIAVKIYGDDLPTLARIGSEVAGVLRRIDGGRDIKVDRVAGLPVLRASVDRQRAAQRGVVATDVLDAVETIGGKTVGTVLEDRRRFALRVRLESQQRNDLETIARLPIRADSGVVALADVADLVIDDEPLLINHDATQRRLIVQANVRGRDLGGYADEAQARVASDVKLPPGYRVEWGGQFANLRSARSRLLVVVPLTLILIGLLLYTTFRDIPSALLILLNVPFAITGGILALVVRGLPFTISAAVGFVALFGVAVLNGLVLVSQIRHYRADGMPIDQAAEQSALRRLRPVLTTALVASIGFVPMAIASGAGAEVQRPLATVVIGGLISSTALTLLVLPAVYAWFGRLAASRAKADTNP